MIVEREMLTVRVCTLSKKIASQIRWARHPDQVYRQIMEALRGDLIRPMGWVDGEAMPIGNHYGPVWLVEYEKTLYWVSAPYHGNPEAAPKEEWMQKCCNGLKQIFLT